MTGGSSTATDGPADASVLPCRPETISTTSSYTVRVAARSGSKSRLMEEKTGTQTKNTHTLH